MSTITTIAGSDVISASRSTINTNFSNLNTDKAELSGATFTGAVAFSGTTNSGLKLNNLSTVQRDALASPANGMVIYNTTDNQVQQYENGSWNASTAAATNASTTVKGIVEEGTQAEVDAGTATGGTGARTFVNPSALRSKLLSDYVADTGAADAYVITPSPAITAYATGQIFSFRASATNTGTSTVNVNALGVKTIKKGDGTVNLAAGDITSGQLVVIEYNATSGFFQMLNSSGNGVVDLATAQTVAGLKTFTTLPQSAATPSATSDLTTKTYVDSNRNKLSTVTTAATWQNTDTNERTWFTVSIPANTLSTGNAVVLRGFLSYAQGASIATKQFKLKYGGTTIFDSGALSQTSNAVTKTGYVEIGLIAAGATNSQKGYLIVSGQSITLGAAGTIANVGGVGTAAEDSTTTLNLLVTIQDGSGNSADTFTLSGYTVEKIQ